ncbi:putative conserved hypothetical protein [Rosellinia necatrix]|uniref:Uncharacterized protein n=1 Tax=Rosellinia necatrix TaxID=77044 RepID=A0A1W2TEZ7_ROSNE|nr:putative conserved hypothetical protein [Rosellinia necatrix]
MSSTTMTPPIPIVLVGIHADIGRPIAERLRPDWDVVRQIQTLEAAEQDLPHLLRGRAPPAPATNDVGSGAFDGRPVRAVIFGRAFAQSQAEALYGRFGADADADAPVAWVACDNAKRPVGGDPPPDAGEIMLPVFRAILEDWKAEDAAESRLILY